MIRGRDRSEREEKRGQREKAPSYKGGGAVSSERTEYLVAVRGGRYEGDGNI